MAARAPGAGGGFSWAIGGQPDSNDTAAALEALRVAGVHGAPVTRAVRFLLTFQNRDGGFELTHGRGSDAQSTAWAIQGLRRRRAARRRGGRSRTSRGCGGPTGATATRRST